MNACIGSSSCSQGRVPFEIEPKRYFSCSVRRNPTSQNIYEGIPISKYELEKRDKEINATWGAVRAYLFYGDCLLLFRLNFKRNSQSAHIICNYTTSEPVPDVGLYESDLVKYQRTLGDQRLHLKFSRNRRYVITWPYRLNLFCTKNCSYLQLQLGSDLLK